MASHNIDSRYDVTDTRGPEPHAHLINPYIRGVAEAVRIKQWIEIKQQLSECGDGETLRGAPDGFTWTFEAKNRKTEHDSVSYSSTDAAPARIHGILMCQTSTSLQGCHNPGLPCQPCGGNAGGWSRQYGHLSPSLELAAGERLCPAYTLGGR